MWGWASSRPQCCLKVGADSVAWAEAERNWRGRRRYRCVTSPLPVGSVKLSSSEPNLVDPSTVEGRIRTLAGPGQGFRLAGRSLLSDIPRRIVLLLPDTAVRAVALHLDQLPSKPDERETLIRWRLGQEQLFPLSGAKVVSQVFPAGPGSGERTHSVLAVAIQESVLDQYEMLCESAGLIPYDIGLTSLRLFDLWQRASGRSRWTRRDFLWASVSDHALTTMVFQRGRLLFYRCKLLGVDAAEVGKNPDVLAKIIDECGASLDVCQQRHPSALIKEAVICADGDLSALQAKVEAGLDLSVEQLGWRSVEALGWMTKGSHRSTTSFAVLAGVS
ncbi:MAG TPA: hypothetical protein VD738_02760 [Nitrospira sp.]|nr:hypothetical protein [Nitrospira sp.]